MTSSPLTRRTADAITRYEAGQCAARTDLAAAIDEYVRVAESVPEHRTAVRLLLTLANMRRRCDPDSAVVAAYLAAASHAYQHLPPSDPLLRQAREQARTLADRCPRCHDPSVAGPSDGSGLSS